MVLTNVLYLHFEKTKFDKVMVINLLYQDTYILIPCEIPALQIPLNYLKLMM